MSHVSMTAPAPTNNFNKKRHASYTLPHIGLQPAILYKMIDKGTQDEEYEGKAKKVRKLEMAFELPFHKTFFWEDDTEAKPFSIPLSFTYAISKNRKTHKKSNLLIMLEGLYGPIPEAQYLTFDISQLLGQKFMVNVQHYEKKDGTIGAKITQVSPVNPQYVNPASIVGTNEVIIYSIQQGFDTMAFAKLNYYDREKIKESEEAKAHAQRGGKFSKFDENNIMILEDSGVAAPSAPVAGAQRMEWLSQQYSYESLKQNGWSDDLMVQNGYARYVAVAPPAPQLPTPVSPMPAANAMQYGTPNSVPGPAPTYPAQPAATPVAPVITPTVVQAPVYTPPTPPANVPPIATPAMVLVATNPSYDLNQMKAQGWTDETLVQMGHAVWQAAPAAPIAVAPPTPAAPPLPESDPTHLFVNTAPAPVAQQAPVATPIPSAPVVAQQPVASPPAPNLAQAIPPAPGNIVPPPPAGNMMPPPGAPQAPIAPVGFEAPAPYPRTDEHDDLPF